MTSDDEARGRALLQDGDLGEFEHPYDTLALLDPGECAAGRNEDSGGTSVPVLSRPPIPRRRRFWHARARGMSAYEFFTHFHCRKSTFVKLVKTLYGTTDDLEGDGGRVFSPCEHVAIFLARVAYPNAACMTGFKLDVPEDWVTTVTMQIARLVVEKLNRRYVTWPDLDRQAVLASEWEEETHMRNVIGEIGATHIRGPKPPCKIRKEYTNFNGFFTTVLLGIVDVRGSFLWFSCGAPGSLRDDAALKKTDLYRRIQAEQKERANTNTAKNENKNNDKGKGNGKGKGKGSGKGDGKGKGKGKKTPPPPQQPGDKPVLAAGACVLGDSAFVERPWLRTPIPNPSTREEYYFNHRHASLRGAAAAAAAAADDDRFPGGARSFGRLKWLFGCLEDLQFSVERSKVIVEACVGVYNFFLAHEGATEPGDDETYRFADRLPTRKSGYGGRAQWELECESDPPSLRKAELDYLAKEGFLERDWGRKGSKRARMF